MSKIWKNIVTETQEEVKATFSEVYASLDFGGLYSPTRLFCILYFRDRRSFK